MGHKLFIRVRPDTTYDLFQKYELVSIRGRFGTPVQFEVRDYIRRYNAKS